MNIIYAIIGLGILFFIIFLIILNNLTNDSYKDDDSWEAHIYNDEER